MSANDDAMTSGGVPHSIVTYAVNTEAPGLAEVPGAHFERRVGGGLSMAKCDSS